MVNQLFNKSIMALVNYILETRFIYIYIYYVFALNQNLNGSSLFNFSEILYTVPFQKHK